jgi:hypothetical protein
MMVLKPFVKKSKTSFCLEESPMSGEDMLRTLQNDKSRFETEKNQKVQAAIEKMQEELKKQEAEAKQAKAEAPPVEGPPTEAEQEHTAHAHSSLLYFSYTPLPMQNPHPAWVAPLRAATTKAGYHVYTPWIAVADQFPNGKILNSLPKRLIPQLCSALRLQEELTLDFDVVQPTFTQADKVGDFDCTVFRNLWFLSRSALVVADLTAPERLAIGGVAHEILYARLFDVPVIGVAPESGFSNPWLSHCTTVLYTGQFNLAKFSPLIRGFAPPSA